MSLTPFGPRELLVQVFSHSCLVYGEDLHERYGDLAPAEAADSILDAYAHELAEKIRWAKGPDSADQRFLIYANGWYDGRGEAADLIDPEVSHDGG